MEDICQRITDYAFGGNPKDRSARIDDAASALVDWVHEQLIDRGVRFDANDLCALRKMVAVAMIAQHDYDAKMWGCVVEEA
jgi:hypothetical protein